MNMLRFLFVSINNKLRSSVISVQEGNDREHTEEIYANVAEGEELRFWRKISLANFLEKLNVIKVNMKGKRWIY